MKNLFFLEVTSYKVGRHHFSQLQLTGGQKELSISPLQLNVTSVLKPGQKVQPYSFQGPFHLSWPWELISLFLGVCFISFLFLGLKIGGSLRRRHWKQNMKVYDSNLSPAHELGKSLRRLQARFSLLFSNVNRDTNLMEASLLKGEKKALFMEELNKVFRMFLLRTLEIPPILYWKDKKILREVKKFFYKEKKQKYLYSSLHLLFMELKKIGDPQVQTISLGEVRLICHLLHKTAYEVERDLK